MKKLSGEAAGESTQIIQEPVIPILSIDEVNSNMEERSIASFSPMAAKKYSVGSHKQMKKSLFNTGKMGGSSIFSGGDGKNNSNWDTIRHVVNAQKFQNKATLKLFQKMDKFQQEKREIAFIAPDGTLNELRRCIIGITMIYFPVVIPLRNAFEMENKSFYYADFIFDGIFLIDLILSFLTGRYVNGIQITKPRDIARLYLKEEFCIDVFTLIPWQLFEDKASSFGWILFKLLRIPQHWKDYNYFLRKLVFSVVTNGKSIQYALLFLNMAIIISLVMLCTHIMNCVWIIIGKLKINEEEGWLHVLFPYMENVQDNYYSVYVNGIYYIFTTIATVGYGDISCATITEMSYACFCMFFGIALFAYIQGGMLDAIKGSLLSGEIKEASIQTEFQNWLLEREQNIDVPLPSKKLRTMRECASFKFKYDFQNIIFHSEFYLNMGPREQEQIFHFYFTEISTLFSSFFRNISDVNIIRNFITSFKPLFIPSSSVVQDIEEMSNGIFFIFKGKVIIEVQMNSRKIPFRELSQGSFFGEFCLLNKKSKFRFNVSKHTDLYCFYLKRDVLVQECKNRPEILKWLIRFTYSRYRYFKLEGNRTLQKDNIFKQNRLQRTPRLKQSLSDIFNPLTAPKIADIQFQKSLSLAPTTAVPQIDHHKELQASRNVKFPILEELFTESEEQQGKITKKVQQSGLISSFLEKNKLRKLQQKRDRKPSRNKSFHHNGIFQGEKKEEAKRELEDKKNKWNHDLIDKNDFQPPEMNFSKITGLSTKHLNFNKKQDNHARSFQAHSNQLSLMGQNDIDSIFEEQASSGISKIDGEARKLKCLHLKSNSLNIPWSQDAFNNKDAVKDDVTQNSSKEIHNVNGFDGTLNQKQHEQIKNIYKEKQILFKAEMPALTERHQANGDSTDKIDGLEKVSNYNTNKEKQRSSFRISIDNQAKSSTSPTNCNSQTGSFINNNILLSSQQLMLMHNATESSCFFRSNSGKLGRKLSQRNEQEVSFQDNSNHNLSKLSQIKQSVRIEKPSGETANEEEDENEKIQGSISSNYDLESYRPLNSFNQHPNNINKNSSSKMLLQINPLSPTNMSYNDNKCMILSPSNMGQIKEIVDEESADFNGYIFDEKNEMVSSQKSHKSSKIEGGFIKGQQEKTTEQDEETDSGHKIDLEKGTKQNQGQLVTQILDSERTDTKIQDPKDYSVHQLITIPSYQEQCLTTEEDILDSKRASLQEETKLKIPPIANGHTQQKDKETNDKKLSERSKCVFEDLIQRQQNKKKYYRSQIEKIIQEADVEMRSQDMASLGNQSYDRRNNESHNRSNSNQGYDSSSKRKQKHNYTNYTGKHADAEDPDPLSFFNVSQKYCIDTKQEEFKENIDSEQQQQQQQQQQQPNQNRLFNFNILVQLMKLEKKFKHKDDSSNNRNHAHPRQKDRQGSPSHAQNTPLNRFSTLISTSNNQIMGDLKISEKALQDKKSEEEKGSHSPLSQEGEYLKEDDNEYSDSELLDLSLEVPIDVIQPAFNVEEFNFVTPYLNDQVDRLEGRIDRIIKDIKDIESFCQGKIAYIERLMMKTSTQIAQPK